MALGIWYLILPHLELAPVEVVPGESDPQTHSCHMELLPIMHRLPEHDTSLM